MLCRVQKRDSKKFSTEKTPQGPKTGGRGWGNRRGRAWRQRPGCELGLWQETEFAQMVLMKRKLHRGGSIRATPKR